MMLRSTTSLVKWVCIVYTTLLSTRALARPDRSISITFTATFGGKPIELENRFYKLNSNDSVVFETFRCYISSIKLLADGKEVFKENNSYHLLDAENEASMKIPLQLPGNPGFDEISFNLGIDSVTNVSGAMGGCLDPTKGMYWTWQSGYINLKLEGRSNLCPTRHNEFQFHLGGYAGATKSVTEVHLRVKHGDIQLNIPLDKFLNGTNLATNNSVMIPGKEAVTLSHKIAGIIEAAE